MDPQILALVKLEAGKYQLTVSESFQARLDKYIARYYASEDDATKATIEAYLSNGAIRIARVDGKQLLEGEDLKASIWLFHQPINITDECASAGEFVIQQEVLRKQAAIGKGVVFGGTVHAGLLSESFARHLDGRLWEGLRYLDLDGLSQ